MAASIPTPSSHGRARAPPRDGGCGTASGACHNKGAGMHRGGRDGAVLLILTVRPELPETGELVSPGHTPAHVPTCTLTPHVDTHHGSLQIRTLLHTPPGRAYRPARVPTHMPACVHASPTTWPDRLGPAGFYSSPCEQPGEPAVLTPTAIQQPRSFPPLQRRWPSRGVAGRSRARREDRGGGVGARGGSVGGSPR